MSLTESKITSRSWRVTAFYVRFTCVCRITWPTVRIKPIPYAVT